MSNTLDPRTPSPACEHCNCAGNGQCDCAINGPCACAPKRLRPQGGLGR